MGEKRSRLTVDERARAGAAAAAHLAALPEMRAALDGGACIAGFVATRDEMDPIVFLDTARRRHASVALPRVSAGGPGSWSRVGSGSARLRFHIAEPNQLVAGRFGIPEPADSCPEVPPAETAVMIVPGLAFDDRGNRLGFGGGYYDELLGAGAEGRPAFVVGLGYDFQVVDDCPADGRDARVDCIVTEARVIRCAAGQAQEQEHAQAQGQRQEDGER